MVDPRNAKSEANAVLDGRLNALVLEPSPPAVTEEPFADDPLARAADGAPLVLPFAVAEGSATTWRQQADGRSEVTAYAMANWLGPWKQLAALPAAFADTRLALHRLAAYVVSPARRRATTKIGLRYTAGGFGTPFFADPDDASVSVQIRVAHSELIVQRDDTAEAIPITTLREAGAFVGIEPDVEWAAQFDIPEPGDLDAQLTVDAAAAGALADWYGFAYSVLEELRHDAASVDASNPQLWPEHFDPAIEVGSDAVEHRGSYGFSPGDAEGGSTEPYVYISAWYPDSITDDTFWNSTTFPGAILTYAQLLAARDQRAEALDFLRHGRDLLAQG